MKVSIYKVSGSILGWGSECWRFQRVNTDTAFLLLW